MHRGGFATSQHSFSQVPLCLNCCGFNSRTLLFTLYAFTDLLLILIALHHACRTEAEKDRHCWQSLRGYELLKSQCSCMFSKRI
jgi:hypothetical protein